MFFFVVVHDKKQDHRVIQVEAIRSGLLDVLWTESRETKHVNARLASALGVPYQPAC